MKCVCLQVILLGGVALGAGTLHHRFASQRQKDLIADTLRVKPTTAQPVVKANGNTDSSPTNDATGNPDGQTETTADNSDQSASDPATYSIDTMPEMLSIDQASWLLQVSAMATGEQGAPDVYFLDAREHKDYIEQRVWGAFNVTPQSFFNGTLPQELKEYWPRDTTAIVVYCQGGNCDASHLVSTRLRIDYQFKKVFIMADGLPGWIDANLPTESGQPEQ